MPRAKVDLPEEFPFRTELEVRIADINYGGHLGNDAVLSLIQEARVRFLGQFGYTERNVEGVGLIMLDAAVIYKGEAFHGDVLSAEVAITALDSHSCEFAYRLALKSTGREIARAKTTLAFFDYERRKIAAAPDAFASRLNVSY